MFKFKQGDLALLVDRKNRKQVICLEKGDSFHSHIGIISHDKIIGATQGAEIASDIGGIFTALSPKLSDYIMTMERAAQVIYPKDLGQIIFLADIKPGVKVFESGVGSGALSLALLQAGAKIVGYENRQDHLEQAQENMVTFLGKDFVKKNYELCLEDSYQGIKHDNFDRVVLDLPEPWQVVPHLEKSLNPGGSFLAYTPSIVQATELSETLKKNNFFGTETIETLDRKWHIMGKSVRPEHKMVGHTGFLTYARKV